MIVHRGQFEWQNRIPYWSAADSESAGLPSHVLPRRLLALLYRDTRTPGRPLQAESELSSAPCGCAFRRRLVQRPGQR